MTKEQLSYLKPDVREAVEYLMGENKKLTQENEALKKRVDKLESPEA